MTCPNNLCIPNIPVITFSIFFKQSHRETHKETKPAYKNDTCKAKQPTIMHDRLLLEAIIKVIVDADM